MRPGRIVDLKFKHGCRTVSLRVFDVDASVLYQTLDKEVQLAMVTEVLDVLRVWQAELANPSAEEMDLQEELRRMSDAMSRAYECD